MSAKQIPDLEQPFLNRGTIVYFTWPEPFPRMFFDDEPGLLGRCVADFNLDLWLCRLFRFEG